MKRAKRQYDKNCCRTQYQVGDAVWYLIKGTRKAKNKVKKFLPSYEGPFFVLGHLDDLVYRIQKGPKTKVKVVHHDQLKPYRSRDPLDNTWALERAHCWTPVEVSPPKLESDPTWDSPGCSPLQVQRKPPATLHQIQQGTSLHLLPHLLPSSLARTSLLLPTFRIVGVVQQSYLTKIIGLKGRAVHGDHQPSTESGWLTDFKSSWTVSNV